MLKKAKIIWDVFEEFILFILIVLWLILGCPFIGYIFEEIKCYFGSCSPYYLEVSKRIPLSPIIGLWLEGLALSCIIGFTSMVCLAIRESYKIFQQRVARYHAELAKATS